MQYKKCIAPNICVASLQKGPHVAKIKIKKVFFHLYIAGHDKSVEK